jgi:hypothetical protein
MKMRVFAAASILLAVVLVAPISYAAPSCCDPNNGSTPGAMLAPGQPTRSTIPAASPQQRVATPRVTPAMVRATGSNWSGPVQRQVEPPSRWVSRTLPPHRVVVLCPTTAGPQEESIPQLRPSFAAVGAAEATVARLRIRVFSLRVAPFSLPRIRRAQVNRPTLRAKQAVAHRQGPATIRVAGTHHDRSSARYGDLYRRMMRNWTPSPSLERGGEMGHPSADYRVSQVRCHLPGRAGVPAGRGSMTPRPAGRPTLPQEAPGYDSPYSLIFWSREG